MNERRNIGTILSGYGTGRLQLHKRREVHLLRQLLHRVASSNKKELKIIKRYAKRKHIKPVNHENVNFDLTCPFRDDEKKVCMIYEVRPFICRTFICNKPQNKIEWERDILSFNSDFHVINLRLLFQKI